MTDRPDLTPEEAIERFLAAKRVDTADSTLNTYHYRLDLFRQFCDEHDVETMHDIDPWLLEEYLAERRAKIEPITMNNEFGTLRLFLRWCGRKGVSDPDVAASVDVPQPSADQEVDETRLEPDRAECLVDAHLRDTDRFSALFLLLWFTGARLGAVRGLDVRDFDRDEGAVWFKHRPDTGTPLKRGPDGERVVALPGEVVERVDLYLRARDQHRDDHGRRPLLSTDQGRPVLSTLREWCYRATIPCLAVECPHGRDRPTCEWSAVRHASKCPSSRSPHQVRTGSVTYQLNQGIPPEAVAERVNSDVSTIKQHYDHADPLEEMRQRRAGHIHKLRMNDTSEVNDE